MNTTKNFWFIGTGQFAALCLEGLTRNNITFSKIITGLPTRSGRNGKEKVSPVEHKASELGLITTRTGKLSGNHELISALNENTPQVIFVIDFGQLVREPFLSAPKTGCINIHPSLLPEYRGAAPIQRALLDGKSYTGVSAFKLVNVMDAGDILVQERVTILPDDNASDLYMRLSELGCKITAEALNDVDNMKFTPQDNSRATFANKLDRGEFEISFNMAAEKLCNTIRALDMSGGAFMFVRNRRVKFWRVKVYDTCSEIPGRVLRIDDKLIISCSQFAVEVVEIQSEGKKRTTGVEWARGMRLKTGDIL